MTISYGPYVILTYLTLIHEKKSHVGYLSLHNPNPGQAPEPHTILLQFSPLNWDNLNWDNLNWDKLVLI